MVRVVFGLDISPALELSSLGRGVLISQRGLAVLTLPLSLACEDSQKQVVNLLPVVRQ